MRADSKATVEELLDVAERLFAERGVENVALTAIVGATRQKNRSAIHYHFGSRGGVLAAVLNRRLEHINASRHRALDEADGHGLRAAMCAYVMPLLVAVTQEPWGADYVGILAQVGFHPRLLGGETVENAHLSAVRRCKQLIEAALPDVPSAILSYRLRWFNDSLVLALARAAHRPGASSRPAALRAIAEDLVEYGIAGLSARVAERGRLANPRASQPIRRTA